MLKALLISIALANAGDAASSCYAFSQGLREANPLLPTNCAAVVAIKAGVTSYQMTVIAKSYKPHPKATKIVAAIVIAIPALATIHNLYAIQHRGLR